MTTESVNKRELNAAAQYERNYERGRELIGPGIVDQMMQAALAFDVSQVRAQAK